MANFQTAQKKAKRLTPQRISSDLFKFIRTIEEEFAAFNRATIFDDSEGIKGQSIGFYSKATDLITGGEKAAGDPFTLKDTGKFLDELFAKVKGTSILFGTDDPKKKEVFKNLLTEDLFGLQDDDLKRIIDSRILPFLLKYFRKNLI